MDSWLGAIISNWVLWSISKLIDIFQRAKNDNDEIKTSRFIHIGKPIFKGEIVDRKDKYERKTDSIVFRAKYNGKVEHGYFAAEIIPPTPFLSDTFHLDNTNRNVTSFCDRTITENIENDWNIHNIPANLGKLNGQNIKTDWLEWTWTIPKRIPKGDYRVILGLWSNSNEDNDKIIPIQFSERSFYVIDSDDSHYPQKVAF